MPPVLSLCTEKVSLLLATQEPGSEDEPILSDCGSTRRTSLRRASSRVALEAAALAMDDDGDGDGNGDVLQDFPTVRLSTRTTRKQKSKQEDETEETPQSLPTVRAHRSTSGDESEDDESSVKPALMSTKSGVVEVRPRRERKPPTRWAEDPLAVAELGGSVEKLRTASAETVFISDNANEVTDVDISTPGLTPQPEPESAPHNRCSDIKVGTKLICIKKSQARGKRTV